MRSCIASRRSFMRSLAEVRWMTSFDTTEEEIRDFTRLIKKLVS